MSDKENLFNGCIVVSLDNTSILLDNPKDGQRFRVTPGGIDELQDELEELQDEFKTTKNENKNLKLNLEEMKYTIDILSKQIEHSMELLQRVRKIVPEQHMFAGGDENSPPSILSKDIDSFLDERKIS